MLIIQFLIDQNVPDSVARFLRSRGHVVHLVREVLLPDSPDPLIATISEENGWVLISGDHDFEKIAPRIPKGSQTRFRRLSRISLQCSEYQAAARLKKYIAFIEMEYENSRDTALPMRIIVQNNGFKING